MSKILSKITKILVYVVVIFAVLVVTLPIIWFIITSFKSNTEIMSAPYKFPEVMQFGNYYRAVVKAGMAKYALNSLIVVLVSMLLILVLAIPGAYTIARIKFKASKYILGAYIACLFLQVNVLLVPLFIIANKLHLHDNLLGLSLILATLKVPFTTFLLQGFMRGISKEYEYAAMIDGCSNFGILWKVIVPMSKPAIVTASVMSFFGVFNEYILTLVMIPSEAKKTLPVGLANLYEIQRYATDWGALFAGLVIVLIPTLIIYSIGQNSLVKGMNVGGLKG